MLIPFLMTIGLKFLTLLPIMLSKIALLGIMNFVSSNLNLLISIILGLKNLFMKNHWSWYEQETPQFEISPIETSASTTKFDILQNSHSETGPKVLRFLQSASAGVSGIFNKPEKTYHYILDPRITKKLQNSPIVKPTGVHNKKYHCQQIETNSDEKGEFKCMWIDTYQNNIKKKIFIEPSLDFSKNKDQILKSPTNLMSAQLELNNRVDGGKDPGN